MEFLNKKVILFDLDGTLIDSVPDLASAVNYTLKTLDRKEYKEDEIRTWVGNGAETLVKRALLGKSDISENIDNELFQKALTIFLKYYKNNLSIHTKSYDGVHKTLEELYNQGYILTIATNKPYEFILPILKALKINHFFKLCVGAGSVEKKKPDPMMLTFICDKLEMAISDCIMIGDSKNDIISSNTIGMENIGVTYGYNYSENISTYNPNAIVDNFCDISKLMVKK